MEDIKDLRKDFCSFGSSYSNYLPGDKIREKNQVTREVECERREIQRKKESTFVLVEDV